MTNSQIVAVEGEAAFWDDTGPILSCLQEDVPRIPPWFGYDGHGSVLFEEITQLPNYYLTRVERELLRRHAPEIAECIGPARLAELGSGSAKKTRLLLQACVDRGPTTYLPIDVSREMLVASSAGLTQELPGLHVVGMWGRYEAGLARLRQDQGEPLVVAFLGSNLGNTTPEERTALLAEIARSLAPGDGFLVSADLEKSDAEFEACYNDPPGHTAFADFRRNHLVHLNSRFRADFRPERFVPRAHYAHRSMTVEGHLYPLVAHAVVIPDLDTTLWLEEGSSINVGYSAKFARDSFVADIAGHGLVLDTEWIDREWSYGIFLFRRPRQPPRPDPVDYPYGVRGS